MANRTRSDGVGTPSVIYDGMRPKYELITDLLEGTKRMRELGGKYLPKEPLETQKAYNIRINRSFLFNGLKGAIQKIVAKPFSRKVNLVNEDKLPDRFAESKFVDNVDGKGTNLSRFTKEAYQTLVALGAAHILVDFTDMSDAPRDANGNISRATEINMGARPVWRLIKPTDMFAWELDHDESGAVTIKEIRFREVRIEKQPGTRYATEEREYVHVWRSNGEVELWKSVEPVKCGDEMTHTFLGTRPIKDFSRDHVKYKLERSGTVTFPGGGIPLVTIYADKIAELVGEPPLLELANTNVEHWQSNSDQRNILRFARLAQKVISGATSKDLSKENMASSVHNVMTLKAPEARAYYLEHSGKGIEAGAKDLDHLEEIMRGQGMQPLMEKTIDATATSTMVNMTNVSSDAQAWAKETQGGIRRAFVISGQWTDDEIPEEFDTNVFTDFASGATGGKDFDQLQKMRDRGDVSQELILEEGKRRGLVGEDVDVAAEIEKTQNEQSLGSPGDDFDEVDDVEDVQGVDDPGFTAEDQDEDELIQMGNPFKVFQRGERFCVVKLLDQGRQEPVPGGCHGSKANALRHFRALEAVAESEKEQ